MNRIILIFIAFLSFVPISAQAAPAQHVHHMRARHHHQHASVVKHHRRWRVATKRHDQHLVYHVSASLPVLAPALVAVAMRDNGRGNFTGFRGQWCKAGLNVWLRMAGYFADTSLRAIDALRLGPRLRGPAIGAVFVKAHHTGIVTGETPRGILTISANHSRRVGIGIERGILAFVAPRRL